MSAELLFALFPLVLFLLVMVFVVGGTALWIWMLVDAVQVPDDRLYRSGNKVTWILVIALTQILGAAIYYFAGRPTAEARAWYRAQFGPPPGWGPPAPYQGPAQYQGPPAYQRPDDLPPQQAPSPPP